MFLTMVIVSVVSAVGGGVVGGWYIQGEQDSVFGSPYDPSAVPSGTQSRPPDTVAGVAQRVRPSVVSITAQAAQGQSTGSGFVVDGGYVVTNNHVIELAAERGRIEIEFGDGDVREAQIVGRAASFDLAVLEVAEGPRVQPLEFGDSDSVVVGDTVIAIGSPLGLNGTVTTGIISAVDRPVAVGEQGAESYFSALQTDAAINPGNSGGPLVDVNGRVIGVNTAIDTVASPQTGGQGGSIGLGFAIPSNQVNNVVQQLITTGQATYAVIGAVLDIRYPGTGARIIGEEGENSIIPNGPAENAGLRPGDIITEFNGSRVTGPDELIVAIRQNQPGDTVDITYLRGDEENTTQLTLGNSTD